MGWVTLSLRKRELKQEHQYYQLRDLQISREKRRLARQKSYEMAVLQSEEKRRLMPLSTKYRADRQAILDEIQAIRKGLDTSNLGSSEYQTKLSDAKKQADIEHDTAVQAAEDAYKQEISGSENDPLVLEDALRTLNAARQAADEKRDAAYVQAESDARAAENAAKETAIQNALNSDTNYVKLDSSQSSQISSLQLNLQDLSTEYTEDKNAVKDEFDDRKQEIEDETGDQETELEMEQTEIEAQMEAISQEIQAVSEAISSEIQNSTIKLS